MVSKDHYPFSVLLRQFRARAHLSQQALAEQIGLHRNTIVAWEQGSFLPKSRPAIQALAVALGLSTSEGEALLRAGCFPHAEASLEAAGEVTSALPRAWQVPYPRNPFFTGREAVLEHMHHIFQAAPPAKEPRVLALRGLGGIGKTQLALEYTYRSRHAYRAVLWAGAETRAALTNDVLAFAATLDLPERGEPDQQRVLDAVKGWLQFHSGWLLILDNVHDLARLSEVLPSEHAGQVLLTTQLQATGAVAHTLLLGPLTHEEGALLLLRRAKHLAPAGELAEAEPTARARAGQIAERLGGLPLAIDQAGAYLEETGCGLAGYLTLYERHQATLLARRGGARTHPEPVATTWALAFAQVEQASPAAADLLRLCAYLAPEAIPEEIFTEGGTDLPATLQRVAVDELRWQETCAFALRYSLLARQGELQLLSLHRLVQVVLRATQEEASQRQWAERVIRLVNRAFPQVGFATWEQCQRLLPQALACAGLIEQWGWASPEAARLLAQTSRLLRAQGAAASALSLCKQALAIREQVLEPTHPDVGESLHHLATLYHVQGQHDQALPLYQRALAIREQALGPTHPDVAWSLNNLAELYRMQRRDTEALALHQQALTIFEQALSPTHPDVARSLSNLAELHQGRGQYEQAQLLFERALAIDEQVYGAHHPEVATDLSHLALLYQVQGHYEQAQFFHQRALVIKEQALGPRHPAIARCLEEYAVLLRAMQQSAQAEALEMRAQQMRTHSISPFT